MAPGRLAELDAFLLDLDGTFYVDDVLQPRARELCALLDARGKRYLFLTNNSSRSAADYEAKLRALGLPVGRERILTSGQATARYLRRETELRRVYLVGTPALAAELAADGIAADEAAPEAVVLGFDTTLTYERLAHACLWLERGLPYVATHPDFTCITREGLIPDTGAFIAGIEKVTGRLPDAVIGKPEPTMVAAALERLGGPEPERTAMVGDQLDTDLTMAERSGLYGILVLSGETSRARLESQRAVQPDLVLESIAELHDLLA
jgi:HAD superfamily hydrolase (TIGR01450 family)